MSRRADSAPQELQSVIMDGSSPLTVDRWRALDKLTRGRGSPGTASAVGPSHDTTTRNPRTADNK